MGLKDAIDPHDGCPTCGGGGSARYLGTDGKPISAATVRRLACEADLIPVVLGGDGQVLDLGHRNGSSKNTNAAPSPSATEATATSPAARSPNHAASPTT